VSRKLGAIQHQFRSNLTTRYFFNTCKRTQEPFVVCKTRTKFAGVTFDYISFDEDHEARLLAQKPTINARILEIYSRYGDKKSKSSTSSVLVNFDNLMIENAEKAAAELYEFLTEITAA
jgi:hypothetical protein